jgi:hypothetical protein
MLFHFPAPVRYVFEHTATYKRRAIRSGDGPTVADAGIIVASRIIRHREADRSSEK